MVSEGVQIEEVIVWVEAIPESMVWKETRMSGCQPVDTPIKEVSQYMHNPREQHMNAVMRILSAMDDKRSTSIYFTFVGGNLVTWKTACDIAHNPVQHDRTKHVEVDKFFNKEKLDDKIMELPKIRPEDQLADILTKDAVLSRVFSKFLDKLGMCDIYAPT
ncbi:hypothetical protein CK203_055833 [Vitis vinifera]|uniref:Retrovirus-related Pol polyprotein from transposon RE1 n=1 Tax=Vitis vinifera TaxID=29760 RepID=A0A438H690_VITVI|nr:hypothetical protein CK203_055833 [Vitis vinifera]